MTHQIIGMDKFIFDDKKVDLTKEEEENISSIVEEASKDEKTIVMEITSYPQAKEVVDLAMQGYKVIIQLATLASTSEGAIIARRTLDYIGGAMYALKMKVSNIANMTFVANDK